jgi:hypothetical protein
MNGENPPQPQTAASETPAAADLDTFTGAQAHPSEPLTPPAPGAPDGDDESQ